VVAKQRDETDGKHHGHEEQEQHVELAHVTAHTALKQRHMNTDRAGWPSYLY